MKYPRSAGTASLLTSYLIHLTPELQNRARADFMEAFGTEAGANVLEILEKAVMLAALKPGAEDRALREFHGARLLTDEIRRVATHGPDTPQPEQAKRRLRR